MRITRQGMRSSYAYTRRHNLTYRHHQHPLLHRCLRHKKHESYWRCETQGKIGGHRGGWLRLLPLAEGEDLVIMSVVYLSHSDSVSGCQSGGAGCGCARGAERSGWSKRDSVGADTGQRERERRESMSQHCDGIESDRSETETRQRTRAKVRIWKGLESGS